MPSLIEENLYLGDLNDAENLKRWPNELQIKSVYTIGIFPMLSKRPNLTYQAIEVADLSSEDLLSHFDAAYDFILKSQREGPILVHCFHGVSRSATVVIAFLMKRHGLDVSSARARVKAAREAISPNEGFSQQLDLYARMGTKLDSNFPAYKVYRLKKCARIVRDVRLVPVSFSELIRPDPSLTSSRPNPNVYKCRKCRRVLFTADHVLTHQRGGKFTWKLPVAANSPPNENDLSIDPSREVTKPCDDVHTSSNSTNDPTNACTDIKSPANNTNTPITGGINPSKASKEANNPSDGVIDPNLFVPPSPPCTEKIFIEPLVWMKDVRSVTCGKLVCPRCAAKLGSYSWTDYCVCGCRSKIFPFFYVTPSKIDFHTVVKNVQVTV